MTRDQAERLRDLLIEIGWDRRMFGVVTISNSERSDSLIMGKGRDGEQVAISRSLLTVGEQRAIMIE